MRRAPLAAVTAALLAATVVAPASATAQDPATVTETVVVTGAVFVPDTVEVFTLPEGRSETMVVTAPADEIDAVVAQRVAEASARLKAASTHVNGPGSSINKENVKVGECGTSWVRLSNTGSQTKGQGYVTSRFFLDEVRTASKFWTTTTVYKTGWSKKLTASGDLKGKLEWEKGTRVDVPSTAKYNAKLASAKVVVVKANGEPGTCWGLEPTVTGIQLYVSKS